MTNTRTLAETLAVYRESINPEFMNGLNVGDQLLDACKLDVKDECILFVLSRMQISQVLHNLGAYDFNLAFKADGITIPMQLDGVVFPLILVAETTTGIDREGLAVHEVTHAKQLNRLGLEEFVKSMHVFKGYSFSYFANKLESEAYINQFKYVLSAKIKRILKWRA